MSITNIGLELNQIIDGCMDGLGNRVSKKEESAEIIELKQHISVLVEELTARDTIVELEVKGVLEQLDEVSTIPSEMVRGRAEKCLTAIYKSLTPCRLDITLPIFMSLAAASGSDKDIAYANCIIVNALNDFDYTDIRNKETLNDLCNNISDWLISNKVYLADCNASSAILQLITLAIENHDLPVVNHPIDAFYWACNVERCNLAKTSPTEKLLTMYTGSNEDNANMAEVELVARGEVEIQNAPYVLEAIYNI